MMIKKMIAAMSAVAIMGTSAAYNGAQYSFFRSYAAESAEEHISEGCAMISIIAPNYKLPDGVTAKLVEVNGEERKVLAEWEPASTDMQTFSKLSLSDDISYKIIIENIPEYFYLPEETDINIGNENNTDKIVICGFSMQMYPGFFFGISNGTELHFARRLVSFGSNYSSITSAYDKDRIEEAYITDDQGFRYINAFSDSGEAFIVPDGHYTAYVKPAEGYSFVPKNSEAALYADPHKYYEDDYFDHDFSKGIDFNVKNGVADKKIEFYIEEAPTSENTCSAEISVIDEDTGELLEGCVLKFTNRFSSYDPVIMTTTKDKPIKLDDIRTLNNKYELSVKYLPPFYKAETDYSFTFAEFGEHKDIVIKAKRTVSEEEAAKLKKVELPKEDPIPVDKEHCAVTIAAYDLNTFLPPEKLTAFIVKRANDENNTETELASWDVSEEPVKTFTDIEYDPDAAYYLKFPMTMYSYNNAGSIKLSFKKGGDTDKIAVPLHESYMYGNVDVDCCICTQKDGATSYGSVYNYGKKNFPLETYGIYNDNGYRYCYASALSSFQIGKGALPDGEYTFRITPEEGYRVLQTGSEYMCISSLRERFSLEELEQNCEKGSSGIRFKVENGLQRDKAIILIEEAPTAETACSADISVVDEATGEPINDVQLKFVCSKNSSFSYSWNTSDTSVMKYDNLLYTGSNYKVFVKEAPKGYEYSSQGYQFSFTEYGQHEDIVIKLKKNLSLGDVNGDGIIDAVDASNVLRYYAIISTDQEGGFTDDQKAAADVNKDGEVNAVDSSNILAYYAYASISDAAIKTMEEFINKK